MAGCSINLRYIKNFSIFVLNGYFGKQYAFLRYCIKLKNKVSADYIFTSVFYLWNRELIKLMHVPLGDFGLKKLPSVCKFGGSPYVLKRCNFTGSLSASTAVTMVLNIQINDLSSNLYWSIFEPCTKKLNYCTYILCSCCCFCLYKLQNIHNLQLYYGSFFFLNTLSALYLHVYLGGLCIREILLWFTKKKKPKKTKKIIHLFSTESGTLWK